MSVNLSALVVDSDARSLMTIDKLLKSLQVRYKRNTCGANVLAQARALYPTPDFVLLDVNLPEYDALAICRALKSDARLKHVPVIALINRHDLDSEVLNKLRESGFAGVLQRPLPRHRFSSYLNRILNGERLLEIAV